jgi:hypothetical protein
MSKSVDQHFRDWFNEPFGYGYGSGEESILYQLRAMVELLHWNEQGKNYTYDYKELEDGLGEATAWLLINALCKNGDIDYGTSPRYGWFYGCRKTLVDYIKSHEVEDMYNVVADYDSDYHHCSEDYCDCYPSGQRHERCRFNPFWNDTPEAIPNTHDSGLAESNDAKQS